jgi:hypothetical protein
MASQTPTITPQTLLQAGSISKPGAGALYLVERGKHPRIFIPPSDVVTAFAFTEIIRS